MVPNFLGFLIINIVFVLIALWYLTSRDFFLNSFDPVPLNDSEPHPQLFNVYLLREAGQFAHEL